MQNLLKTTSVIFLVGLFFSVSACNDALDGFGSEAGSTVSVPGSVSAPTQGTFFNVFYDIQVADSFGQPANGRQVQLVCTRCTFFDTPAADGGPFTNEKIAAAVDVGNLYFIQTNSLGGYQVLVNVQAPSNFAETSYTATVTANIGVSTAQTSINVF